MKKEPSENVKKHLEFKNMIVCKFLKNHSEKKRKKSVWNYCSSDNPLGNIGSIGKHEPSQTLLERHFSLSPAFLQPQTCADSEDVRCSWVSLPFPFFTFYLTLLLSSIPPQPLVTGVCMTTAPLEKVAHMMT